MDREAGPKISLKPLSKGAAFLLMGYTPHWPQGEGMSDSAKREESTAIRFAGRPNREGPQGARAAEKKGSGSDQEASVARWGEHLLEPELIGVPVSCPCCHPS